MLTPSTRAASVIVVAAVCIGLDALMPYAPQLVLVVALALLAGSILAGLEALKPEDRQPEPFAQAHQAQAQTANPQSTQNR